MAGSENRNFNLTRALLFAVSIFIPLFLAGSTSADPLLSAQDKKELDQAQKLMLSGRFEECMKIALTVPAITTTFAMAAVMTNPDLPVDEPVPPGTFAKLGEQLNDISAQVKDPDLSRVIQKLGKQVTLQEGKRPAEVTPAIQAEMKQVEDWAKANCDLEDDSSAANPVIGPAQAARPVAKISTDAQQVTFSQLSANDVAIVLAAKGIQLGGVPGPAAVQVIFDPNAPYGAKLYQQLAKLHPDLPVRWLPVAYITKSSTALVSLLINSQQPEHDLGVDLKHYDFAHHHGGLQPDARDRAPLPAAQRRLLKGLIKWSYGTPTIVFRDRDGRWLETMGSGTVVINSMLARAAKN